jgi:TetR/AcrR family transcriptional regulator
MVKNTAPTAPNSPSAKAPSSARLRKEAAILAEAENQFAQFGFEGTSLETIGAAVGISRHNLLYYFPSKEALYRRVLDDVMDLWLAGMDELAKGEEPMQALQTYIAQKLRFSQERPKGVNVFTKEVMAGAPRYGEAIAQNVKPLLRKAVRRFERWASEGLIAKVDFTHLMFIIWSTTQAYAEQQAQFAMLLGKTDMTARDFDNAQALILRMVGCALAPDPLARAQAG